jgi:hypothetical protein
MSRVRDGHLSVRIEREDGFVLLRLVDASGRSVTARVRPGRADSVACLLSTVARLEAPFFEVDILGTLEIRNASPPV